MSKLKTYFLSAILILLCFPVPLKAASDFSPREIYKKTAPAVVFISSYNDIGSTGNAGSGSLISSDGLILTNSHVLTDQVSNKIYKTIIVCLKPDKLSGEAPKDLSQFFNARIVANDPELDLAILKILNPPFKLPSLIIGDSDKISTGDQVAAIGHPEGGGLWILTTGTISGTKKIGVKDTFQTETPINKGNSGGPLLDANGFIIGVNTYTIRKDKDGSLIAGVSFALKSSQVSTWLNSKGIKPIAPYEALRHKQTGNQIIIETKPDSQPGSSISPSVDNKKNRSLIPEKNQKLQQDLDEELRDFKGSNGEIMYGIPEGKFSLDTARRLLYQKTKSNAEKAFEELDRTTR